MPKQVMKTLLLIGLLCAVGLLSVLPARAQGALCTPDPSDHYRIGINVERANGKSIDSYNTAQLHAGWYHDYSVALQPSRPNGIAHAQMVRSTINTAKLDVLLGPAVDANPGVLWLLGNEPDRFSQDGVLAAEYATFYHDVYTFLKARDPSAQVAIGGLLQPTPLRLLYLDAVMSAYQNQYGTLPPADAWHIHNFILREATDWGAYYPPGFVNPPYDTPNGPVDGRAYNVEDHGDLAIFTQQIRDFRAWMARNGYRDLPLVVSEYGILLPEVFGYDHNTVRDFMFGSFDFFLTATDTTTGYPADGNRLVQQWAWFTLNDDYEFNGGLLDFDTGAITPLGQDFADYTTRLVAPGMNLGIGALTMTVVTQTLSVQMVLHNSGAHAAENVQVRLWDGDPRAGGVLLSSGPSTARIDPACSQNISVQFTWPADGLAPGSHDLYVDVQSQSAPQDTNPTNNYAMRTVQIEAPTSTPVATATPETTPVSTPVSTPVITTTATITATALPTESSTPAEATPGSTPNGADTPTPSVTPSVTATPDPTPNPTPGPTPVPTVPALVASLKANVETVTAQTELITYTLQIINAGRRNLDRVTVTDTVPDFTTFVAEGSSPGWLCHEAAAGKMACSVEITPLAAGSRQTLIFQVRVTHPLPRELPQIENRAAILSDTGLGSNVTLSLPVARDVSSGTTTTGKRLVLPLIRRELLVELSETP